MGELLDQCGDKNGPATTTVASPMGGQGDVWCHQWDTDHVTMLDKTIMGPGLPHLTSQNSTNLSSLHFLSTLLCLAASSILASGGQDASRKTHPFLSFRPATHPSFRVTSYVMERKEDKSFVTQGKMNKGISAKNIHSLADLVFPTHVFPTHLFPIWFDGIFLPENFSPFSRSREQMTAGLTVLD